MAEIRARSVVFAGGSADFGRERHFLEITCFCKCGFERFRGDLRRVVVDVCKLKTTAYIDIDDAGQRLQDAPNFYYVMIAEENREIQGECLHKQDFLCALYNEPDSERAGLRAA